MRFDLYGPKFNGLHHVKVMLAVCDLVYKPTPYSLRVRCAWKVQPSFHETLNPDSTRNGVVL